MQDFAENTPELFLKVLDFTENKDILPLHVVDLAKNIKWDVLLRNKFSQDFETKEDIKAKFEWLSEYEPKDIHAIAKMISRSKKKEEKYNDNTIGKKKRKREEEDEIIFQSKALKCFYYWTKGWSKVLKGHTNWVESVIKLNETTIVSASRDRTLRVGFDERYPECCKGILCGQFCDKIERDHDCQCKWGSYVACVGFDERYPSGVDRTHGLGHNGDKIERDHGCQWKW